jgi:hypothetical protein
MDRGVDLRPENAVQLLRPKLCDEAVVEIARRMNDGGERAIVGNGREQGCERLAIGAVARGEVDLGAERRELLRELVGAFGAPAPSRRQQEMPCAVGADEMRCDESAEGSGPADDEDRAVR